MNEGFGLTLVVWKLVTLAKAPSSSHPILVKHLACMVLQRHFSAFVSERCRREFVRFHTGLRSHALPAQALVGTGASLVVGCLAGSFEKHTHTHTPQPSHPTPPTNLPPRSKWWCFNACSRTRVSIQCFCKYIPGNSKSASLNPHVFIYTVSLLIELIEFKPASNAGFIFSTSLILSWRFRVRMLLYHITFK